MAAETETIKEAKKFNDRVRLGTIAGSPFFFNYSFLLLFLFAIFVDPINLILFISLLFFSITIHELAHALASRYLGLGGGTLTIWFLGGFFIPFSQTSLSDMSTSQRIKYAFMVLAGPLSNIALAGFFLLLTYATSMDLLYAAAQFNLSLAILNLLPIGYLDGGNIIRYLGSIMADWRKVTFFSGILALALAVIIFVGVLFGWRLGDYSRWIGFLIVMGIGTIKLTCTTDEQLLAGNKKTIDRELALTQTTSQSEESKSSLSMAVKFGLAILVLFSAGHIFNQYWTYRDLPGRIVFIDASKSDKRLHLYITQKLGFPTIDADGVPTTRHLGLATLGDPGLIAFLCDSSEDPDLTSICINDELGKRITEIPTKVKKINSLLMSPDARKIALSSYQQSAYVVDISSGAVLQISNEGKIDAWSVDGNYLLMTANVNGNYEIFRTDSLGRESTNLTSNPAQDVMAAYTHDGRYIYFLSDRDGKYDLFRMDQAGSNVCKIALQNEIHESRLSLRLSPDDSRLLFSCGSWGDSICVVNTDGTNERILAEAEVATWSPDGKYVAITGSFHNAIFILTPDGKQSVKLKGVEFVAWDLAWLP